MWSHGQDESDQQSNENRENKAPNDEKQRAPSANEMVVAVVPFARLSRRTRVVDGEDSEKGVEQKAAHGKPHISPRMSNRLRPARVCTSDDAAFC